ncbi:hypothetical protein D5018_01745 [Parashewanella curva]|uniref:Uncharacterized protein n=1 Tax=Parashewanella curva TaxID=2338552 RepID=A0A3L8Q1U1_9GAMM|nr:hypothetical protein [Parashewanella curva]RLV61440.1 hypothetical protein D5018_01745 [Parashewanella curva]
MYSQVIRIVSLVILVCISASTIAGEGQDAAKVDGGILLEIGIKNQRQSTVKINKTLGFFRVNNIDTLPRYGLLLRERRSKKEIRISPYDLGAETASVSGEGAVLGGEILYDDIVSDVFRQGQRIRRIKVDFKSFVIDTPFKNRADRVDLEGSRFYDIFLIDGNQNIISGVAEEITKTSIPVEIVNINYKTHIYIEGETYFNDVRVRTGRIDIPDSYPVRNFFYALKSNKVKQKKEGTYTTNHLVSYVNDYVRPQQRSSNKIYSDPKRNSIFFQTYEEIELGHAPGSVYALPLGYLPSTVILGDDIFGKGLSSGWYEPSLYMSARYPYQSDFGTIKKQPNKPNVRVSELDREIVSLITHVNTSQGNRYFDPKPLEQPEFHKQRFYIVSKYDKEGRIELKPLNKLHGEDKTAQNISLKDIANGDKVWYGSSVRWFSTDLSGKLVIRDGYLGWHDPRGKYAFLKLHNGQPATGKYAPKVGTVFVFNWAKWN